VVSAHAGNDPSRIHDGANGDQPEEATLSIVSVNASILTATMRLLWWACAVKTSMPFHCINEEMPRRTPRFEFAAYRAKSD
jgi:hypothetical protein